MPSYQVQQISPSEVIRTPFAVVAPKVDAQEKVAACLRKINCGNAGFCVTVKKRAALVLVVKKRFWSGAFVQVDGFSTDGIDQVF